MFQTYSEAVKWITELSSFGIRPGLDRMNLFMEKLGNPQRRLKFIHVAGTNGKGSVCAYLHEILHQSGYGVGMFTSPYIGKYVNRIQMNGEAISEDDLLQLVNKIKPIYNEIAETEHGAPTSFEVSTVLAILYFATVAYPDYVVWETGLGGRLDSTNIVHPVISVITNIGLDHTDVLGTSVDEIAAEKAGIIQSGVPVVTAARAGEGLEVIMKTAKQHLSSCYVLDKDYRIDVLTRRENEQSFSFTGPFRVLEQLCISMNGAHQLNNAATALMTIEVLRQYMALISDEEDIRDALMKVKWPGRMEMVSQQPRILLDGAHNEEGAKALVASISDTYTYDKLHVVLGMLETKNHRGVIEHILSIANTVIVTQPEFVRRLDSEKLGAMIKEEAQRKGRSIEVHIEPDWRRAVDRLQQMTGDNDLGVITGTLYLISDARTWIEHHTESEKGW